jgi:hypothetical protein
MVNFEVRRALVGSGSEARPEVIEYEMQPHGRYRSIATQESEDDNGRALIAKSMR